ncbi:MAG: fibronectin type III domain-containing protein [Anaerovoracaceae bacterium]
MKRKGLTTTVAICLIVQLTAIGISPVYGETGLALAKDTDMQTITADLKLIQDGKFTQADSRPGATTSQASLENYIAAGLKARKKTINISKYKVSATDAGMEKVHKATERAINNHPELFYIGTKMQTSYTSGYIVYVSVEYTMSAANTALAKKAFNGEVKKVLAAVDKSMTDYEKALTIHDYLIQSAAYDTRGKSVPSLSYRAYGILVNKIGVCQSYAMVYKYIMKDKLGIYCDYVNSKALNHIWNVIKIDGKYYQLDLTWDDDGKNDVLGKARHDHFLLSESGMTKKHGGYKGTYNGSKVTAGKTHSKYNTWKNVASAIYVDKSQKIKDYYYIKDKALKKTNSSGTKSLDKITTSSYLARKGKQLYYNDGKRIIGWQIGESKEEVLEATPRITSGISLIDGTLWYQSASTVYAGKTLTAINTLPAPIVMSATKKSSSSISITWNKLRMAQGYEIYRRGSNQKTYTKVKTVGSTTYKYTNTNLAKGKKYYYRVKPLGLKTDNTKFKGTISNAVAATIP